MLNKLLAEAFGTAFLLIGVVGSGIMAAALSPDNTGVALLANAIATGCILYVIITLLGPISGAHFNPAVTIAFLIRGDIGVGAALAYVAVQIAAGILGVWIAHLMFELPILQLSTTIRSGPSQWVSEIVATFGLVFVILGGLRHAPAAIPTLVGLYITGAYWFTSSTSFANPAVTIARSLSDTFAGILPGNMPMFIVMQLIGASIAVWIARRLFAPE
ncbi:MIP/aquaporin family protein [Fontisubflavum oceani]|uniref:MIP/aquaporin family protein n=1 Tax=Fontisubflavum oceani TaxID=2978973 RepID=UPI0025B38427|nr:MIP/aquaporin family protein [Fontisubflavum oceani]WJY20855.1 MIP/aquaporin family protein [Fontisubflavum oceani]